MRTYEHRARIIWPRDDSLVPIEDEELEEPDEGEQGEVLPVAEDTTRETPAPHDPGADRLERLRAVIQAAGGRISGVGSSGPTFRAIGCVVTGRKLTGPTEEPSARELARLAQKVLCQASEFLVDTWPDEEEEALALMQKLLEELLAFRRRAR